MKKLRLDDLAVESFATAPTAASTRGTVRGHGTQLWCPVSYGGTCWITCEDSCGCDTDFC